jgi:hypothetical protein
MHGDQIAITVGATNAQTLIDLTAPQIGARIDSFTLTQKTAGTGTGSFTLLIEEQGGTDLTNTVTVAPDAAAEVIHGTAGGLVTAASATGVHLAVKTTKTGTITDSCVMILNILWQM